MKQLIAFFLIVISFSALGQDRIVKKSGDILTCTVTEVGADEIKYFYSDQPNLIFSADKALVARIEFANGEIIDVEKTTFDKMDYYANQRHRALKFGFLSPLFCSTEITFEKFIKPGASWEVAIGAIGIGYDPRDRNPTGIYAKVAYKLTRTPDYYFHRMHYAHILKGAYFAPEIAVRIGEYSTDIYHFSGTPERKRVNSNALAFFLKFGKQWIFQNAFLIDVFAGIGYGGGSNADVPTPASYGFLVGSPELPIAFTSGLRVGIIF